MQDLIQRAWDTLSAVSSLKRFNFFPAVISAIWLLLTLLYQGTITAVSFFDQKDTFLIWIKETIFGTHMWYTIGAVLFLLAIRFVSTPLAQGGIIHMIHLYRASWGQEHPSSSYGLSHGLSHILPMIEIDNITAVFRPLLILTAYILILRVVGTGYTGMLTGIFFVYFLIAIFLNICFAYARYSSIFEHTSPFQALTASTKLALRHFKSTTKLYISLSFVYLRIALIALLFLVLPFVLSSFLTYLSIGDIPMWLVWILTIVPIGFLFIISHLHSTVDIFAESAWYELYWSHHHADQHEKNTLTHSPYGDVIAQATHSKHDAHTDTHVDAHHPTPHH